MAVSDVSGDKRIFLRKASGLIRTASGTDTFIYNLGVVSIGLGVGTLLVVYFVTDRAGWWDPSLWGLIGSAVGFFTAALGRIRR